MIYYYYKASHPSSPHSPLIPTPYLSNWRLPSAKNDLVSMDNYNFYFDPKSLISGLRECQHPILVGVAPVEDQNKGVNVYNSF